MKNILKYVFLDAKKYFTDGRFRPKSGYIACYCSGSGSAFGSGKTVSSVDAISRIVDKYNGKHGINVTVWTNIQLFLPCRVITIDNLQTFVDGIEKEKDINNYNILFIDEMAAEFNNRNFSKNFTPDFLAKLVTCRHYNTLIIYTAQSFYMVDKVFRDLTTYVYTCKKHWRFFSHKMYCPEDMELLKDARYIAPIKRSMFFADDVIFSRYDTFARYKAMDKAIRENAYKSADEISQAYCAPDERYSTRRLSKRGARVIEKGAAR